MRYPLSAPINPLFHPLCVALWCWGCASWNVQSGTASPTGKRGAPSFLLAGLLPGVLQPWEETPPQPQALQRDCAPRRQRSPGSESDSQGRSCPRLQVLITSEATLVPCSREGSRFLHTSVSYSFCWCFLTLQDLYNQFPVLNHLLKYLGFFLLCWLECHRQNVSYCKLHTWCDWKERNLSAWVGERGGAESFTKN